MLTNNDINFIAILIDIIIPDTNKLIDNFIDKTYNSFLLVQIIFETFKNLIIYIWLFSIMKLLYIIFKNCKIMNKKIFYHNCLFASLLIE